MRRGWGTKNAKPSSLGDSMRGTVGSWNITLFRVGASMVGPNYAPVADLESSQIANSSLQRKV